MRRDAGRGAAVERVTRTMSLTLGVGAGVYLLLSLRPFLDQWPHSNPVWATAAAVLVFGAPLVAAVISPWVPLRLLRALAGVCASGYLLALLTFVPLLPGGHLDWSLGTPWLFGTSVIPTAASAVAWRPRVAWPFVVVSIAALGTGRYLAAPTPAPALAFQDALHTFLLDAIFVALAFAIYRAGRILDETADAAIAETRAAASTEARNRERTRVEALLHDTVLVALLGSARGRPHAAEQARVALAELERLDDDEPGEIGAISWMWRLQALTTDLAPDAYFSHEVPDAADDACLVPAEAGQALLEATAEALRNSVQHAGPAARAVHARLAPGEIEVTVLDDGAGFDPDAVGPGRLGVAVSILDRMGALPGGRAAVVSRPGVGTRVSIAWRAA